MQGDSGNLFFLDDSQKPGSDILVGQGGDDDYDMEGGNDIGVAGPHPAGSAVAYEVRAFFGSGPTEDPVTGSLNAALGQWLISTGRAPSSYVAAQGTRLGRRGRVHVDRVGDDVWVGGDTVLGVAGTVAL